MSHDIVTIVWVIEQHENFNGIRHTINEKAINQILDVFFGLRLTQIDVYESVKSFIAIERAVDEAMWQRGVFAYFQWVSVVVVVSAGSLNLQRI